MVKWKQNKKYGRHTRILDKRKSQRAEVERTFSCITLRLDHFHLPICPVPLHFPIDFLWPHLQNPLPLWSWDSAQLSTPNPQWRRTSFLFGSEPCSACRTSAPPPSGTAAFFQRSSQNRPTCTEQNQRMGSLGMSCSKNDLILAFRWLLGGCIDTGSVISKTEATCVIQNVCSEEIQRSESKWTWSRGMLFGFSLHF